MKIRNGFVSNSSSSSFVILGQKIDFSESARYISEGKTVVFMMSGGHSRHSPCGQAGHIVVNEVDSKWLFGSIVSFLVASESRLSAGSSILWRMSLSFLRSCIQFCSICSSSFKLIASTSFP